MFKNKSHRVFKKVLRELKKGAVTTPTRCYYWVLGVFSEELLLGVGGVLSTGCWGVFSEVLLLGVGVFSEVLLLGVGGVLSGVTTECWGCSQRSLDCMKRYNKKTYIIQQIII